MGLGIRLTVFAANDRDLDSCFPGWREPLPEPRVVEQINPFTREPMTALTWDPGRPHGAPPPRSVHDALGRKIIKPVLPPEGGKGGLQAPLDDRDSPALLRTFPHITMWGVTPSPLHELLAVLNLPTPSYTGRFFREPWGAPPARIVDISDDEEQEGDIICLPDAVIEPLATLDDRAAKACLAAWRKALEIRPRSVKEIEEIFGAGSTGALRRIRALAAEAHRRGGHLFVATRPSD